MIRGVRCGRPKSPPGVPFCTGCYKHETLIEKPVFIGTYEIPRSYFKSVIGYYYDDCGFYFPDNMEIKIELV